MSRLELDRHNLVVVTGAGGFVGGHLVAELRRRGFERVRALDIKPPTRWYQQHPVEQDVSDLSVVENACREKWKRHPNSDSRSASTPAPRRC